MKRKHKRGSYKERKSIQRRKMQKAEEHACEGDEMDYMISLIDNRSYGRK